jgi:hypothetical protein
MALPCTLLDGPVRDAVDAAQLKMLEGLPGNGDALNSMLDTLEAAIKD